jgi:hypothetical protein
MCGVRDTNMAGRILLRGGFEREIYDACLRTELFAKTRQEKIESK